MPCIFCGAAGKLSREHVFPQWPREALPESEPVDYVRRIVTRTEGDSHLRPGVAFDVVVRDVCASCNNGWLSDLEARAMPVLMPMLKDAPTRLGPVEQAVAATWVTKTMLTLQGANLRSSITADGGTVRLTA